MPWAGLRSFGRTDACEFRPERWLDDAVDADRKQQRMVEMAGFGFSHGQYACPGEGTACTETGKEDGCGGMFAELSCSIRV